MSGKIRRILVVDDSPELCGFLALVLGGEGYEVRLAESVDAARQALAGWTPEVVIADVRLPGSPPFGVVHLLKAEEETHDVPVLLCSGAVNEIQTAEEWLREQEIAVLSKPFEVDALLHAVAALVEQGTAPQRDIEPAKDSIAG